MKTRTTSTDTPTNIFSARARLGIALLGWLIALVGIPLLAHRHGAWILLAAPWVGAYFVSWLGMLRHELWHGYVKGINNRRFFRITCFALCVEPETYRLSHGSHHIHVNTEHDMQMYPENFLQDPRRARVQFLLELMFGNLAWEFSAAARLKRSGQLSTSTLLLHLPARLALPAGIALAFGVLAPDVLGLVAANFALMVWSGSVMTRHNQWLQHLGILCEGTMEERNLRTRNLRNKTWLERLVNFLNHDDSVAHTYHHTEPNAYTRLDPNLQPASHHLQITLGDYARILRAFHRSLLNGTLCSSEAGTRMMPTSRPRMLGEHA